MNRSKADRLLVQFMMLIFVAMVSGIFIKVIFFSSELKMASYQDYDPKDLKVKHIKIENIPKDAMEEFKKLGQPSLIGRALNLSRTKKHILTRIGRAFILELPTDIDHVFVVGELDEKLVKIICKRILFRPYSVLYCLPQHLHLFEKHGFKRHKRFRFDANIEVNPQDFAGYDIRLFNEEEIKKMKQKHRSEKFYGSIKEIADKKAAYGLFVNGKLMSEIVLIGGEKKEERLLGGNFQEIYIITNNLARGKGYGGRITKYVINECNKRSIKLEWVCDEDNLPSLSLARDGLKLRFIEEITCLKLD